MKRVLITVAAACLLCAVIFAQMRPKPNDPSVESPAQGRYQIVLNPNIRADTFLLDTQTGRVWVQTQITDLDEKPTIWKFRERLDTAQDFSDWSNKKLELQSYQRAIDKASPPK